MTVVQSISISSPVCTYKPTYDGPNLPLSTALPVSDQHVTMVVEQEGPQQNSPTSSCDYPPTHLL